MRGLAREADLARLRARVGLDSGEADAAAGARGDVDDAPIAGGLHPGHDGARAHERARQVRVDDRAPVVVCDLLERAADLSDDAARIVDEDVDGADPFDERRDPAGVRDVDGVAVDTVHGCAVTLERGRDRGADAVRRAGDKRRAAAQIREAVQARAQAFSSRSRTSSTPACQTSSTSSSGRS